MQVYKISQNCGCAPAIVALPRCHALLSWSYKYINSWYTIMTATITVTTPVDEAPFVMPTLDFVVSVYGHVIFSSIYVLCEYALVWLSKPKEALRQTGTTKVTPWSLVNPETNSAKTTDTSEWPTNK